jgi:succinate dehydrogenase flavin-adding protein (antitoxin of CptAB toxin-antitoxin module)
MEHGDPGAWKYYDGSYATESLSGRLEWHCRRVNNEDALLEAIKRAESDGATGFQDVLDYLDGLSVDELRELLESVDHDVFSDFEDDEGEDDGDDGPFVEAMNEVRDDMVATIEYVLPQDKGIIDYIDDVESSAAGACEKGQSAVVQAINAEYEIAVGELRYAASIESEYGDDALWGPVLDWFQGVLNDIEAGTLDVELDNTPYAPGRPVTTKPSSGSDVAGKRGPRRYNTTDLARRLRL